VGPACFAGEPPQDARALGEGMTRTRWSVACGVLSAMLAVAAVARAEDTDQIRGYLHGRIGIFYLPSRELINGVDADRWQDTFGFSLGVNLGRFVGVEVAADTYEPGLDFASDTPSAGATIGEYRIWTVIPQVRVRYPLLEGRLTPYAIAGVGVSFSEFNDRKPAAFGVPISGSDTAVAGSLGLGLEYFLLNNLTVGLEMKYMLLGDHSLRIGDLSGSANPNALLFTLGFRLLYPEAKPAAQ
jgi:opacity protein-like surface antigen